MGVIYTLGFAPFYIFPLAFLAIGTLFLLSRKVRKSRTAFLLGLVFGLMHNLSALYWMPQSFYITTGSLYDTIIYGGGALLLLCFYLSLYPAFTCYILHKTSKSFMWAPLVFTMFWVSGELVRSVLFTGFPWNLTGYIFADSPIIMQAAAWGGVYILSALAVYTAAALTMGKDHVTIAIVIFAFSSYMGAWYLNDNGWGIVENHETIAVHSTGIRVRLVQPNISQTDKWEASEQERILRKTLELSQERIRENNTPDIIIWPETAVASHFLEESHAIRHKIGSTLDDDQLLITGGLRRVYIGNQDEYFNSLISLNNEGEIMQMYDKIHLVPFGEYIPFRNLMPQRIQELFAAAVDYTSGVGKPIFNISLTKAGKELTALPLVCFEAIFPMEVARGSGQADFILNVTNDAWFAGTIGPHQHYAMAKMRAVETGLPVIRVGNTGITAAILPSGRELRDIRADKTGYVDTFIPKKKRSKTSFMTHFTR
jgi:apolipoprotein N-acyltransferase